MMLVKKNGMGSYPFIGLHPYKDGYMYLSNENTAIFLSYYDFVLHWDLI